MAKEQWVGIAKVMAHLDIRKSTMYKKGIDQLIPYTTIGSVRKYKLSEVDAWLAKNPTVLNIRNYVPKTKPVVQVDTRPQVKADTLAAAINAVDKLLAELRADQSVVSLRPATAKRGRPRKVVS
jgi:hypothetical protein